MEYLSLNTYLKESFGCKVYKLAIDGGFTCPNRDGTLGTRGCIFCSGFGSGDFAASRELSITDQIESAKKRVEKKITNGKYIAYFQAFTNTYAPVEVLSHKFNEAIRHPDIVAISIGTRPDCLCDDAIELLSDLNKIKPVWVELGLQTIHKESAEFIRRGYDISVYDEAVAKLKSRGIYVITHIILGLPKETENMMLESVKYACGVSTNSSDSIACDGIKLQLLHIIKGTDLAYLYENRNSSELTSDMRSGLSKKDFEMMKDYECMDLETYANLIAKCISVIPKSIAVHRMTGDGDKKTLLAPLYSGDKKRVLNTINKALNI